MKNEVVDELNKKTKEAYESAEWEVQYALESLYDWFIELNF